MRLLVLTLTLVFLTSLCRAQTALPQRLRFVSVTPSENTGQNYAPWLSDELNNLVQPVNGANLKWTQVTLTLERKSLVSSLRLYCQNSKFPNQSIQLYALNGSQRILIGQFKGGKDGEWITLTPFQPLVADAIMVYKYGNNIPQKIQTFGEVITSTTIVPRPSDTLKFGSVSDSPKTGQDYSNYLNDNIKKLVTPYIGPGNERWTDVTIRFDKPTLLTKVELYDGDDAFPNTPAEIYVLSGAERILLGTFTGNLYRTFRTYPLTESRVADGIVIRKFNNAIPLKIRAYGRELSADPLNLPIVTPPPPTTVTPASMGVKIPITPSRWYQLNNVSNGLDALFDGSITADVFTGFGKVLPTYEAYYPLLPGESMNIKAIRFYDGSDSRPTQPLRLSIITSDWQRIEIGQFQGLEYLNWVGPYPDRQPPGDTRFLLDTPVSGARYLVISTSDFWPTELELYGDYTPGDPSTTPAPAKSPLLKNLLGINAFEWDFYPPGISVIDETKMHALKTFGVIRHYMDWEKVEFTESYYTFNPTRSGGWDYDQMYARCKADGIEVMTCFKDIAPYLKDTYPTGNQHNDNIPIYFGRDPALPQSYLQQARAAFQFAARYGKNTAVNPALVKVDNTPRYNTAPINVVKIGLGLINYIECENERDKWWMGRWAYQSGREYAANMSAFYDGHKNTMGPDAGVKNADPTMKVVMGGLVSMAFGTDYVRGMVDWCREHRGIKPDGRVDLCWDVINYHLYSDNANSMQSGGTRGATPELSVAAQVARNALKFSHDYCYDMPVFISETGYDVHPDSPLRAIPIGPKSALITQADWNLRTALMYAREGIDRVDFYQTYDQNILSGTQFASMGFLNSDFSRKPTADYFYQTKRLLGDYMFKETISTNPNVDRYEHNGQSAYALWIPDEMGRTGTYTLDLNKATGAQVFSPQVSRDTMSVRELTTNKGRVTLTLTETPIFVKPVSRQARVATTTDVPDWQQTLVLFPNPTVDALTLGWTNDYVGEVAIRVMDAGPGLTRQTARFEKKGADFQATLDLSALPFGVHLIQIQQGEEQVVRRVLKVR